MPILRYAFLEHPWPVYLVAGLGLLVTIAVWQQKRSRAAALLVAGWPVLALGTALLAAAVVTDRERIDHTWQQVNEAIAVRSVPMLMEQVADDFQSGRVDRAGLRDLAERAFRSDILDVISLSSYRVTEVGDTQATAVVTVIVRGRGRAASQWKVTLRKQPDGRWLVSGAESVDGRTTLRGAANRLRF